MSSRKVGERKQRGVLLFVVVEGAIYLNLLVEVEIGLRRIETSTRQLEVLNVSLWDNIYLVW